MMSPASTLITLSLAASAAIASPVAPRQWFDGLDGLGDGEGLGSGGLGSGGLGSGGLGSGGLGSGNLGGFGGSSTRDDLKNGDCKDTIVIFARGTGEIGNVGTVTGPPFFDALDSKLGAGKVAVQGVDYAASWSTVAGGDPAGIKTMADLVTQAANKCADSNIVMSGYSQGAELVHNAAKSLSSDVLSHVSCAVNFGDPFNGQDVEGVPASLSICHSDDSVCNMAGGGSSGTGGHLGYSATADEAAAFVVKHNK